MAKIGRLSSNSGNYAGNDTANRTIPHGLGKTPTFVAIIETAGSGRFSFLIRGKGVLITFWTANNVMVFAVNAADATNFHVGNAGSYVDSANASGNTYYWVAFA